MRRKILHLHKLDRSQCFWLMILALRFEMVVLKMGWLNGFVRVYPIRYPPQIPIFCFGNIFLIIKIGIFTYYLNIKYKLIVSYVTHSFISLLFFLYTFVHPFSLLVLVGFVFFAKFSSCLYWKLVNYDT